MSEYTTESIQVLEGLDPVRQRPGMYTDTARPNHLVTEVIDNSVDEALAGFAKEVGVVIHDDGSISVIDDGRGMPVEVHSEYDLTGVELILTRLHAGAKFDNRNYAFAGGLHGVGVSVVNALSTWLDVEVKTGGSIYRQSFRGGCAETTLEVAGTIGKRNTGTIVHFLPDPKYFDTTAIDVSHLRNLLRAKSILCPGLKTRLTVEQVLGESITDEWLFEDGLKTYLQEGTDGDAIPADPFTHHAESAGEAVEWAMQWVPGDGGTKSESYVNLIPTPLGGTHVNGLRAGLAEAMREFCEFQNLLPRSVKITAEDVASKCSYVLSARLEEPQFSGQTKERLSSRQAAVLVSGVVKDAFSLWLSEHPTDGKRLAELAIESAQLRAASNKKVARKTIASGPALPGKLADCASQDASRSELFLVEGDSAGGSAKQARDREFQAVLPLRGKIKNTWEVSRHDLLTSATVRDIAVAIGVEPGSEDISRLRYHKVCILADADSDGLHIATLLCALFLRHFPALVHAGHLCVAMPPLYRIDVGKTVYYALDEAEKEAILHRLAAEGTRSKPVVQRFKGLGEMDALQLRESSMAPATRRLVRVKMDQAKATEQSMDMLLAKARAPDRKRWLEAEGDQAILP